MAKVELPDDATIRHWKLDEGISYREMVERWYELSAGRWLVTRQAFAMRCSRNGWTTPKGRNPHIPWVVEERHKNHHYIQMLRYLWLAECEVEGIPPQKFRNMEYFFAERLEKGTVIHYEPNSAKGFHDVPREKGDKDVVRDPDYHEELMKRQARKDRSRPDPGKLLGKGPV